MRSDAAKRFAANLLPTNITPLTFAVSTAEDKEYRDAITDAMEGAAATLAKEAGLGARVTDFAQQYLRENSLSKLTGNLEETTKDRLRGAIADAWDAGGSYDQIVSAITDTFDDFSEVRAGMIAQTEAIDAYNASRDDTAREFGLDEKSWETESGDPCPVCIENEDAGWIGIDEDFPSGDDQPTAHVNCQCVVNFRGSGE